jgi:membrane-bound lytic murein transglycosylase A
LLSSSLKGLIQVNFVVFLFMLLGCGRVEVKDAREAMRKVAPLPSFEAELDEAWIKLKSETQSRLLNRGAPLTFGPCQVSVEDYREFLQAMPTKGEKLGEYLQREAQWFAVFGRDDWSEILLTSYFSPIYPARRLPEGEFTQPVYRVPKDLIEVSLSSFAHEDLAELETDRAIVSARLTSGPGVLQRVTPYFSRWQIDGEGVLKGRNLELAYLKPIDAFFLQIQGSGQVEFSNGKRMTLGYGAQNGYRYRSIGKLLYDIIPKEKMSMGRIEKFLETLKPEELTRFLAQNPSYVFFKELEGKRGLTTFGAEVQDRRTLAVDTSFFPLGAMALLKYPHPLFKNEGDIEPYTFEERFQWVFAHDTGGAIKGVDRADLYWGSGKKAQQAAGVMKNPANLWFVAPKKACSR